YSQFLNLLIHNSCLRLSSIKRLGFAMNKELREKAIEAYLSQKEGFDWSGLMHYAQVLLGSRDDVQMGINSPKPDGEKFKQAQKEGKKYLENADIKIDPNRFRDNCAKMLESYIRKGVLHDSVQVKSMKAINWQDLTDKSISMAMVDPNKFFLLASMDLASEDQTGTFQMALAGLLINVVRAYLDSTGEAMTELLSSSKDSSLSPKSLACPVCGSVASISSIDESESSKSRGRKLFCACCGTAWPFETERCGLCGQTDPEKRDYLFFY
ncbi:MAG: formate dehydrogenase accessory protein FdhE, partial [Parabacteroides sp.]|nr:formate dehydrogenase accessory protein FdhE [Parabacteroides sp.]